MVETVVEFRDTRLRVSFDVLPGQRGGRRDPPIPDDIEISEITLMHPGADLSGLITADGMEEIVKIVFLKSREG